MRAPAPQSGDTLATSALERANFKDLPGWSDDDVRAAWPAFLAGCTALQFRPQWHGVCVDAQALKADSAWTLRKFFTDRFVPWRVRNPDGSAQGLMTGYYEPIVEGSRRKSERFATPLLAAPTDLIGVDLGDLVPELKDAQSRGLRPRGRLVTTQDGRRTIVPYWSRAELESRGWTGEALVWLADPIEAFFLQVQGSGRVRLEDGSIVRVGYADTNGYPYRSIGRWLIDQNELKADEASMQGIQVWARLNPGRLSELLNQNPAYVYFRELPVSGDGPIGAMGVPLTAERSIAVDPKFIPLGAPVFVSTTQPLSNQPLRRLMMAQDTGSAIRGAVRADVYWGSGAAAGEIAGRMKQRGELFVLLPR
ncbi:murein transglycosylase A [soil metagenome]